MPTAAPRRPTATAPASGAGAPSSPAGQSEVAEFVARHAWSETPNFFVGTHERYDRVVDAGVLTPDDKVGLIDSQIVPKMPQTPGGDGGANRPHRVSTTLTAQSLRSAFGNGVFVQEKPVALSALSEPEPDVAVVAGSPRGYDPHLDPSSILLLVEVAESSLNKDRTRMATLYAEVGIAEYWIVNLRDRVLEAHRDPAGGAYQTKATLRPDETVSPVARPDAVLAVADLLP